MTLEETRALASLDNLEGYRVLLNQVVKLRVDNALEKLKLAKSRDERADAGVEFAVWDDVLVLLRAATKNAVAELKEQGDQIYG